ncbi:TRAP transporter small permease [Paracoccus saliphilus]|uniref:TRAP transporter small permease protein n=2 Tax=Paracoccus saliphilus TaxID=405559 RepID=A0AA46A3W0_9RHOB|nr:TRAP transporter small permease [Paracoccus saliphilus]SIS50846.1 TRAP-type C4-dicarboxylate transport system, small permease component [Paracoccus saliphilus]
MSSFLLAVQAMLHWINNRLLAVGVVIASTALAIMVLAILLQVFFRYVLNNALPWPEEAARFLMLWMTGLAAPAAYRRGGFVAIDMLEYALPRRGAAALSLVLLIVSFAVLAVAVQLGWNHVGSGWLFNSSSLKLPLDLIGLQAVRIKLAWMYMSIFAGFVLLTVVNIELILRALLRLLGHEDNLAPIPGVPMAEAE